MFKFLSTSSVLSKLAFCATAAIGSFTSFHAQAVVFQAEDYAYAYDTTPGNAGGAYRKENVDIQTTSDVGGGYNVGWIQPNEWLAFANFVVPQSGSFTFNLRVAAPASGGSASLDLNGGSIFLTNIDIPATGGWQTWKTVSRTVYLNAGTYNLGLFMKTAGWNLNWIEVLPNNNAPAGYTFCAYENQTCNFTGTRKVAYGAYGLFNYKTATNSLACTNSVFGDPFYAMAKACYISEPTNNAVWSDEFNSINLADWSFETGGWGWGNQEREYYTNGQNASIQYDAEAGSNVLVIEARKENPAGYSCWYGNCEYTSTRMNTQGKKVFTYGRIEARIKLPQTSGIWPAFWLLGNNINEVSWPACGEIDVMEHVGSEPTITHGAMHGPGYSGNTPFQGTHYLNEFADARYHVFAIEWNAEGVTWFVDDKKFYSATKAQVMNYGNWVFDKPFYILLNLAVGGSWPGNPDAFAVFPQRMYVDYVRVYQ